MRIALPNQGTHATEKDRLGQPVEKGSEGDVRIHTGDGEPVVYAVKDGHIEVANEDHAAIILRSVPGARKAEAPSPAPAAGKPETPAGR